MNDIVMFLVYAGRIMIQVLCGTLFIEEAVTYFKLGKYFKFGFYIMMTFLAIIDLVGLRFST